MAKSNKSLVQIITYDQIKAWFTHSMFWVTNGENAT